MFDHGVANIMWVYSKTPELWPPKYIVPVVLILARGGL